MAGESAGRSARRMREKADRLGRAAEKWERGAEGERRTAHALSTLPAEEWTVLHDLPWPGRPRANIDHVAIGPPGVFVIDSKNWTGSITVTDGILRQNGRRRDTAAASSGDAAAAIRHLLQTPPAVPVYGVLCFVRDAEVLGRAADALLCSTANVTKMLQTRHPVLDSAARAVVVSRVATELSSSTRPSTAQLTLGERVTTARESRERSGTSRRSRGRRRQSVMSTLVGASIAIGFLGVAVGQPQVLDRIGETLVSFMTDGTDPEAPVEPPAREPKDQPAKERRSE